MTPTRTSLARRALDKAAEAREEAGCDQRSPVCVYEICRRFGVEVRFVPVSMEGMYYKTKPPRILLSALRPLPRRAFTCAHELGHHLFGHGSTIDELQEEAAKDRFNPDEFLVDTFAGFLLMPKVAVRRAFVLRGWDLEKATPEQVYTVASSFGVGYATLAVHLGYGLQLIPVARAEELKKVALPKIRKNLLGRPLDGQLVVADLHHLAPTVDAEVGASLLLPPGSTAEGEGLRVVEDLPAGRLFAAARTGLVRVTVPGSEWAVMARISRHQYVGLSDYRHLEDDEEGNDDDAE